MPFIAHVAKPREGTAANVFADGFDIMASRHALPTPNCRLAKARTPECRDYIAAPSHVHRRNEMLQAADPLLSNTRRVSAHRCAATLVQLRGRLPLRLVCH